MKYSNTVILKNGKSLTIRNADSHDAESVLEIMKAVKGETEFLLSYPDEGPAVSLDREEAFLVNKMENPKEAELLAYLDGHLVGLVGLDAIGFREKLRHRAEAGVSVLKDYWGLGIGKALMVAIIDCARQAGFLQLELEVVSDNTRAIEMYKSLGFVSFGCNKKGFLTRHNGYQALEYMALEL